MDKQLSAAAPSRRIVFFARPTLHNSVLSGYIQQQTGISTSIDSNFEWKSKIGHSHAQQTLALIEAELIHSSRFYALLNSIHNQDLHINVAFIGVQPTHHPDRLIAWPRVTGVFYNHASQQQLCKGIDSLFAGEYWLPRNLVTEYLKSHRRRPKEAAPNRVVLTKRESQILHLTATGAGNGEIARDLNLSMHTVKTHIYNLFRKLGVSNRMQAVNWAKEYLEFEGP